MFVISKKTLTEAIAITIIYVINLIMTMSGFDLRIMASITTGDTIVVKSTRMFTLFADAVSGMVILVH